jgi:uncharacterized membrane protein YedE/YeeE
MLEPGTIPAALLGGSLIGAAAALMLILNGSILGVSGIAAGIIAPFSSERLARALFIAGMLAGGVLAGGLWPQALPGAISHNLPLLLAAGFAVGFGTRLANGCTSGHGVCGISRLSPRSLVATLVFMLVAMLTVFVVRHVIGGSA